MSRETTLFKSKEPKLRVEVVSFLHDLANRIEQGSVGFRHGSDNIRFDLPEQLTLELQLEDKEKRHKGTRHCLQVELKWYDKADRVDRVELS